METDEPKTPENDIFGYSRELSDEAKAYLAILENMPKYEDEFTGSYSRQGLAITIKIGQDGFPSSYEKIMKLAGDIKTLMTEFAGRPFPKTPINNDPNN